MLVHRERAVCDKKSLRDKLEFPKTIFRENRYSIKDIQWALNLAVKTSKLKGKPTSVALLPHVQMTYGQLSRMLAKHNIKCVGLLPRKISSLLCPVKDNLEARTVGVYSIPCKCGQVYIGKTVRSTKTRIKGHHWHIRFGRLDKVAVAEYRFNHNHVIKFEGTWILSTVPGNMEQLIREAVQLDLHHSNINREDNPTSKGSWKPFLCLLRETRRPPQ
jgi:hypothetical protein